MNDLTGVKIVQASSDLVSLMKRNEGLVLENKALKWGLGICGVVIGGLLVYLLFFKRKRTRVDSETFTSDPPLFPST